jgi:uncharacterized repeat protein (TIGR01451 family)
MKIKTFAKTFLVFIVATFFFATTANAQYGGYGQYGQYGYGGATPTQKILIDKMVGKATQTSKGGIVTYDYVDNLSTTDVRFKPGNQVAFKITVKNTSSEALSAVQVKDTLPSYASAVEGPGDYNAQTGVVTFNAGDFAPGEEKTYYMKLQLSSQDKMPADKGLFCLINKAEATSGNAHDDDTAQFCVEKEVIGAQQVPNAGPEMGILLLGGELMALGAGLFLRKKIA